MATWEPELSILAPEPELSTLQLPALPNTSHPTGSTLGLKSHPCALRKAEPGEGHRHLSFDLRLPCPL